jgi:hypothetical protein
MLVFFVYFNEFCVTKIPWKVNWLLRWSKISPRFMAPGGSLQCTQQMAPGGSLQCTQQMAPGSSLQCTQQMAPGGSLTVHPTDGTRGFTTVHPIDGTRGFTTVHPTAPHSCLSWDEQIKFTYSHTTRTGYILILPVTAIKYFIIRAYTYILFLLPSDKTSS